MPRFPRNHPGAALTLGLLALATLAACVVNLDFTYSLTGQQVQFVNATADAPLDEAIAIDLSQQADVQAHKGNISSISLNTVDMTVSAVQPQNTVTSITGSLWLRPDGATDATRDVLVGALNDFAITLGSTVQLTGSPELDTLVLATVQGTGHCSVIINGVTAGGEVGDFSLDFKFSLSMGYDTGL